MCCVFSAGKGEGWAGRRRRKEGGKWISPPPFRHCKKGDVTSALVLFHPLFTIRYFPPLPPVHIPSEMSVCQTMYVTFLPRFLALSREVYRDSSFFPFCLFLGWRERRGAIHLLLLF